MYSRQEDEAYLALIDQHIEELNDRLKTLKNLITTMAINGQSTRNQSELLVNMLRILKVMQVMRVDAESALNANLEETRSGPGTN
jgi:glutaredoxin 2